MQGRPMAAHAQAICQNWLTAHRAHLMCSIRFWEVCMLAGVMLGRAGCLQARSRHESAQSQASGNQGPLYLASLSTVPDQQ